MNRTEYKIHIIGAGVSGLIAAIELENAGYKPVIIEGSDRIGGRVKTDIVEDYQLDHGFQVLLDAYPMAQKYLDYNSLRLQKLLPGAVIYKSGNAQKIGDPTRDMSFLWPTLAASVGSLADKLNIFRLNKKLKSKTIDQIFNSQETTTLAYLQSHGFSTKIIEQFFKPFFSGIFLESELQTSSRMFEFVYKMFGEGMAVIPQHGIGAIPEQLYSQLAQTELRLNTNVKEVRDSHLITENGEVIETHFTIIATNPNPLIPNLKAQEIKWKSCSNLYFKVPERLIKKPIIGLVADKKSLINNIFYHTSVETGIKTQDELLSVTVVKEHDLSEMDLKDQVQKELKDFCGISETEFIKIYQIPSALPDIHDLQYDMDASNTKLKPTVFLAGDYLLNGSLNAAMLSGERAAQGVINSLEDGLIVEDLTSEYIN